MKADFLAKVFGVEAGHKAVDVETNEEVLKVVFTVKAERLVCPHCGERQVVRKGTRWRELQSVSFGLRPTFLVAEVPKLYCPTCAANFEVAPFAPAYRRLTHRLVSFTQRLAQVMCLADVARFTGLGWDTVKELVQERLEADYGQPDLRRLRYLSIDEIYVSKARKFHTVVINLESGRIGWVAPGKGAAALTQFWPLPRKRPAEHPLSGDSKEVIA